ncbi:hypothetical protein ACFQ0R_01670 [Psychroflexus salinarum]|uniref:Uncharacterized protein n=1 Tax=Psychroflexus salinarum TaxID=546024 RepID=A0ABW3GNQ4_9FLAO
MNAYVENKCEYELLGIIKEISKVYNVKITIETEPFGSGGLIKWLKVVSKDENKNATITTAFIIFLVTTILLSPITKITDHLIDKLFEDTELTELQKEKLRLEINQLRENASLQAKHLEQNSLIKKKKSNFYESLEHYSKVKQVSYTVSNNEKEKKSIEKFVDRAEFKKFILTSDDIDPIKIEKAEIEIISPVLKKGKYKWTGYFKSEPISFSMQSHEFKSLVQTGEIEFKNGSSINCSLTIKRKIDNEGIEKIVGYEVDRVNFYFQNDKPIETSEGKHHRKIKEAEKNQTKLFDNE